MAGIFAWLTLVIAVVVADGTQEPSNITDSAVAEDPVPAHSMHRLIPSVVDDVSQNNVSKQQPPSNITLDTSPFLPSGLPTYRSAQPHPVSNTSSQPKNFTPSYFIGEVIAEPYIPERFQTSRSGEVGKQLTKQPQKLVSSQTAFAIHKILPFLEHMKHAVGHSLGHGHEEDEHVPPVHEPSNEDDDGPKYAVNYEDQHSDRPYYPHHHESPNLHSTRPITFDNGQHFQQDSPDDSSQDMRGNMQEHYAHNGQQEHLMNHQDHSGSNEPSGSPEHFNGGPYFAHDNHDHQKGHAHFTFHQDHKHRDHFNHLSHQDHQQKDLHDHFSHHDHQQKDHFSYFNHQDHQQKDQLDHFSHHDTDFVLPSPFYPPEPEYPASHHKDVHYKVYQNKPKNPLHGLLHFAAALIPLGLFVAALQPSVIQVNSSQPMPAKYRSVDGAAQEVLGLPGLEVLEKLGLGRLDGADCERRAFCELAVLGGKPEGNTAQRGLWKLANSIPTEYAAPLGLDQVLKAVKANSCSSLKCVDPKRSSENNSSNRNSTKDV